MVDSSDQIQRRHNTLNDMTDTTALVFLGLTMGCARCHDHKFEPLSQRDYYSMQAFFTPAKFDREHPVPSAEQRATYEAAMRQFNENATTRELAALEAPARERIFQRKVAKLSPEAQVAHRRRRKSAMPSRRIWPSRPRTRCGFGQGNRQAH
jgi:hypothetical protein